MLERILCIVIGYCFGLFQTGYIYGRLHGIDIRTQGSGNAGTTNALRTLGKKAGAITFLGDVLKCAIAIGVGYLLVGRLHPEIATVLKFYTGVGVIVGHNYPFYLKFKGGKGLACLGGMILAFDWRVFLIMLAAEIVLAIVTDYICFVPLTASAVFPILYGLMRRDLWGALIIALILPLMLYKHKENLKRIKQKTELPFSFLWNKDKALAKTNIPKE